MNLIFSVGDKIKNLNPLIQNLLRIHKIFVCPTHQKLTSLVYFRFLLYLDYTLLV